VTDKLEFLKSSEGNISDEKTKGHVDFMDEAYSEEMESQVIEEFGRCLLDIINTAEKRT